MGRVDGKVVLVTGATSGIGKATALLLASEGAKVVVSGRREAEGNAVVQEIIAAGGVATFVAADVSREADVRRLVEQTVTTYGRLDAAFNNAGTEGVFGPTESSEEAVFDQTIGINLKGAWLSLKYEVLAIQQTAGKGSIVFDSSVVGSIGFPNAAIYSASKGGVDALVRSAAVEYADKNIRVNAVSPGPIETPMLFRSFGNRETAQGVADSYIPMGRLGLPEEIAEAAVFLLSDQSAFITGQVIPVDGGLTVK